MNEALEQLRAASEHLRATYPDIEADDDLWLSSLESITDAIDLADHLAEKAIHLSALEDAAVERARRLHARARRFAEQESRIREVILALVDAAGGRKVVLPGVTLSPRNVAPKVVASDASATPAQYMDTVTTLVPNKKAIAEALEMGADVAGWYRTNGSRALSILVR